MIHNLDHPEVIEFRKRLKYATLMELESLLSQSEILEDFEVCELIKMEIDSRNESKRKA